MAEDKYYNTKDIISDLCDAIEPTDSIDLKLCLIHEHLLIVLAQISDSLRELTGLIGSMNLEK